MLLGTSNVQGRNGAIAEVQRPHFATSFSLTILGVFPVMSGLGNSPVSSKAWSPSAYQISTSSFSPSSSARTVLNRRTISRIAARLKKPSGTVYRAHLRSGCSPVRPPFPARLLEPETFPRDISVHFQPRVVRECQLRRPGSQTSRPPRSTVVGARATSLIGGAFQTSFSTCTRRNLAHVRVASCLTLDGLVADHPGRSLSRSSSPTTTWFLDGTHCTAASEFESGETSKVSRGLLRNAFESTAWRRLEFIFLNRIYYFGFLDVWIYAYLTR